jgi:glycosyltransferase involved in cell wall biosynthesis
VDNESTIISDQTFRSFSDLRVCVIIPTYNNAATIATVISDTLRYTGNIIVVNDGSTDNTVDILDSFPEITVESYLPNRGKGMALRTGFKKAIALGYEYAITIDSDGQHFAKDLPRFIEQLKTEGPALIMGARNMDTADNVPGKSSFGNKFSNFWYKVETGIELPDTQTGYRLYPLGPISKMKFFTRKYEFEIEVIVRLAWAGVKVCSVPITVYYPPKEERISHFRPFKDFTRISIVNTVLVTICFFYIWPRNFFRKFYKNKNWKQELRQMLLKPGETDIKKANAMAFGGFMGIIPIWGFQLLVGVFLAHLFKLNKALFVLAAHISFAPMIPVIVFFSYKMGKPFMGSRAMDISLNKQLTLSKIGQNLEQYIYGSLLLALIVAVVFWLLTFILLKVYRSAKSS